MFILVFVEIQGEARRACFLLPKTRENGRAKELGGIAGFDLLVQCSRPPLPSEDFWMHTRVQNVLSAVPPNALLRIWIAHCCRASCSGRRHTAAS